MQGAEQSSCLEACTAHAHAHACTTYGRAMHGRAIHARAHVHVLLPCASSKCKKNKRTRACIGSVSFFKL